MVSSQACFLHLSILNVQGVNSRRGAFKQKIEFKENNTHQKKKVRP